MSNSTIPTHKVLVAGDGSVGKTSLVRRYCDGKFDSSRVMTIGVDFQTKLVELPTGTVKLSIWDMAGQERFASMRAGFYRGSRATALVFDVTRAESLANLEKWRNDILEVNHGQRFVVVGNKIDLPKAETASAPDYANRIGAEYVETSAATGDGVQRMFEALAVLALG